MQAKVKVSADKNGNIICITKNPEYGYVRVTQKITAINEEGWLRKSERSAFIRGLVGDLLESGFKKDQELAGKIIIKESLTPFNKENPEKDLKMAGETGVTCKVYDEPIYRQSFYTANLEAEDVLIAHTNTIEIREAQAAQRAIAALGGAFADKEGVTL
jgi:hypothetical protein